MNKKFVSINARDGYHHHPATLLSLARKKAAVLKLAVRPVHSIERDEGKLMPK